MKRAAVESSMIKSIGYDAEEQILEVEFNSGNVGQYLEVPADVYHGLMTAISKGRYVLQRIKPNYPYQRV